MNLHTNLMNFADNSKTYGSKTPVRLLRVLVKLNLVPKISLQKPNLTRIFVLTITRAMTTKLTLTIEQDVIKVAKAYAQQKGRSLSELIESYLKTLTAKTSAEEDLSPKVKKLMGSVKLPKDFDYKKTLAEELSKKYAK